MVFSSPVFLFLFLPVLLGLHLVPSWAFRNGLLLVASLFFYWWGEPRFFPVLLASIAVNYALALRISGASTERRATRWLVVAVLANLATLGAYKYANFALDNVNLGLTAFGLTPIALKRVALPLGISFFTFQALAYVIDVYRRQTPAERNPLTVALYVALFPTLIAGPILRYPHVGPQIGRRTLTWASFAQGVRRFVIGLGKKLIIANTLAAPADAIFAIPPDQLTPGLAWLGVLCYGFQIYFDFSGYSDMALGVGRMLGFAFPENFDYPYISRSLTEFWRRWHISLSTWLRDYLFLPLGWARNRITRGRINLNLLIVFSFCGLWHGASWNFVVWGLLHGVFLMFERLGLQRALAAGGRPIQHAYALLVVFVAWVFFRTTTLGHAWAVLGAMAGFASGDGVTHEPLMYLDPLVGITLLAAVVGSVPLLPWLVAARHRVTAPVWGITLELAATTGLALVLLGSVMLLAAGTHNPFIYFRF